MNRDIEYTPFDKSLDRICRSGDRRDVLQLLRQGGLRTVPERHAAVMVIRAWIKRNSEQQDRDLSIDRGLAIQLTTALENGREATAALLRKLVNEEYTEGLNAIDNMEDIP